MPTTARKPGFTLVEVLASIACFTIVFLAGFGGIGKLLLTQDQTYARTLAASAAMLLTDWHVSRSVAQAAPGQTFYYNTTNATANAGNTNILTDVTANVKASSSLKFHGYDFVNGPDILLSGAAGDPSKDTFFVFSADSIVDSVSGKTIDLSNRGQNAFETSEYSTLLVSLSGPSAAETDSRMIFRQLSFWYGPPQIIKDFVNNPQTITLELVGRFTVPDQCTP